MPININSNMVPRTGGYALLDDSNIAGSLHVVANIAARDALPSYVLKIGMLVYTQDSGIYWQCTGLTPTWQEFQGGGGTSDFRQLIYFISEGPAEGFASGAFKEILPNGAAFPSSITWYTSPTKAQKIIEKLIVRNANKTPSQISWNLYGVDGSTIIRTIVDQITYTNGVFEATRTRTII